MLLDGDKIAALAAVYLRQLLSHAPPGTADSIQIGVVQTAYANGASTQFLTDQLGLKVGCTNTGEAQLSAESACACWQCCPLFGCLLQHMLAWAIAVATE